MDDSTDGNAFIHNHNIFNDFQQFCILHVTDGVRVIMCTRLQTPLLLRSTLKHSIRCV